MKMNRYAHAPAAVRGAARVLCIAVLAAIIALFPSAVYAQAEDDVTTVSASEVPVESVPDEDTPADFTRVVAVPANVDIPDFYQEVINVSGMYIFTLPDGTVYKRIYGAIDDVYGWYEPVGLDNIVYADSEPIDTTEDALLYYAAVSEAEREAMVRQDFSGILPPEEGVTELDKLNGVPVNDVFFYCVAGAVLLCLLITIGATRARSSKSGRDDRR